MRSYYDPYDIWATKYLGKLKKSWSKGSFVARIIIPIVGLIELLVPVLFRRIIGLRKNSYPHVEAMMLSISKEQCGDKLLHYFKESRISGSGWGLPFAWYSKNGVYGANTPYVTNTPYVMEALLNLAALPNYRREAMVLFDETWCFLESLKVMYESENELALSYSPIDEPRIVVNANSYASFAYALHALYGKDELRVVAKSKCERIVRWLVQQQAADGSWLYYADNESGNFIDCFHSCFVLKNLLKINKLIPAFSDFILPVANIGWSFIGRELYDADAGLCRRFAIRAQRDPFRWDLYDQAEYLGLLVDFGRIEEAESFVACVENKFRKDKHWYCRIDILNRRWGKDFYRWGIVPFLYQKHRMFQIIRGELV